MTKLLIILSFIFCFAGAVISCATAKPYPVQLKSEWVEFVRKDSCNRFVGNRYEKVYQWIYKDSNSTEFELESDYGSRVFVHLKK